MRDRTRKRSQSSTRLGLSISQWILTAGVLGAITLTAGCGSPQAAPKTPTATAVSIVMRTPLRTGSAPPPKATPHTSPPPTITVALTADFRSFLTTLCGALSSANATTVENDLPYFEYNSGLYYGTFNQGEGQTGSPGLLQQWLPGHHVQCVEFMPAVVGHAAVVTRGWPLDGGWNLVEFDKYNGHWKINDFTFGNARQVEYALRSTSPAVLSYPPHGR